MGFPATLVKNGDIRGLTSLPEIIEQAKDIHVFAFNMDTKVDSHFRKSEGANTPTELSNRSRSH